MTSASADPIFTEIAERLRSIPVDHLTAPELHGVVVGLRHVQWATDHLLTRVGDGFDRASAAGEGPASIDGLLGDGQVSARRARIEAARTALVRDLGGLAEALETAAIGGEHVDVLVSARRRLLPAEREQLGARSAALVSAAADRSVDAFARHVDAVVAEIRANRVGNDPPDQEESEAASHLRWWRDRAGMGHLHARLDALRFESVIQAIENAKRSLQAAKNRRNDETPFDGRLAADALVHLLTDREAPGRNHPKLIVVIKPDGTAETSTGTPVPPEELALLGCDAAIQAVLLDTDGRPLRVGRAYRTATDAQWAALQALYRTCAWHQCDQPMVRCQAHHVRTWDNDGLTDIENLVPLCYRHHRLVHRSRWGLTLSADRELRIHQPDGRLWRTSFPDRLAGGHPGFDPGRTSRTGSGSSPERGGTERAGHGGGTSPSGDSPTSVTRPP